MEAILISLLSGAIGGALITALLNFFSEKYIRKINYLRLQIDKLYGPLHFVLINSEKVLELSREIVDAGGQVYNQIPADRKTEARQLRDDSEMSGIFDLSNEYGDEAVKNNEKIFNIISDNYSLIDLDDTEVVDSFIKNYSRLKIEYLAKKRLPLQVYRIVGDISVLQVAFKQKMTSKFNLKKSQLTEPFVFTWFGFRKGKNN